jgi:hypothetical protein
METRLRSNSGISNPKVGRHVGLDKNRPSHGNHSAISVGHDGRGLRTATLPFDCVHFVRSAQGDSVVTIFVASSVRDETPSLPKIDAR